MEMHKRTGENKKIVVKLDPELAELIPTFLKNRNTDIQALHDSLKKENYEIVERIGHGMKGAGGGFGFDAITEIGARIEKAAQEKNSDEVKNGIETLADYMKHVEVTYE